MFHVVLLQKEVLGEEQIVLIIYVTVILLVFVTLFIMFFVAFQKRKNKLLLDKITQQRKFDEELLKTQQEIQDTTLKHVGRELHDNVGQLLAAASMQIKMVMHAADETIKSKLLDTSEVIKDSLAEVRALSKSLNSDVIYNQGFDKTVANEINRLNKLNLLKADIIIEGEKVNFENKKDEVILFRILQEFFSNTIKYASAEHLKVVISYQKEYLHIEAKDDGDGFEESSIEEGAGLINMKNRAALINTKMQLTSLPGKGTNLTLKYPLNKV